MEITLTKDELDFLTRLIEKNVNDSNINLLHRIYTKLIITKNKKF